VFTDSSSSQPFQLLASSSKIESKLKPENIKVDLTQSIGSGDFGVVYFGQHLGTQVAIKVLKSHDPTTKQNMKQELELLRFTTYILMPCL
jgi:predicted Ser/Thr protein kinase